MIAGIVIFAVMIVLAKDWIEYAIFDYDKRNVGCRK